jgi:hypothetical protein
MVYLLDIKMCVTGIGAIPILSSLASLLLSNAYLGSLFSGLVGAAVAVILSLVSKKGMVLMSALIILLTLVACGEPRWAG